MLPQVSDSSNDTVWTSLNKRVGSWSRFVGLSFGILTIVFLLLSYLTQSIIFEIDSIVTFLAAAVLLFSEPRKRVNVRVLDAILTSSDRTIADLAAEGFNMYAYVPAEKGVSGVVIVAVERESGTGKAAAGDGMVQITPPGRSLAELFVRDVGIIEPSFDALEASLPSMITESFGLADSVKLSHEKGSVRVVLRAPFFDCPCSDMQDKRRSGVVGCTIASFLAVLVCASSKSPLSLMRCVRDHDADTWEVSMSLGLVEA